MDTSQRRVLKNVIESAPSWQSFLCPLLNVDFIVPRSEIKYILEPRSVA